MKTPAELIADAGRALMAMDDKISASHDYASLLSVVLAGGDAETVIDGMHRVALDIRGLADNLRTHHDEATEAVKRLANP